MAIFDLFSKRQKRLRGDVPDIYSYDSLPDPLRVQIIHIWKDTLGEGYQFHNGYSYCEIAEIKNAYKTIVDTLCREYGVFKLPSADVNNRNYYTELANTFLREKSIEKQLDIVELSFRVIHNIARRPHYPISDTIRYRGNASVIVDNALNELNQRFREHGVGYQFINNEIIRIDSELLHIETVKPALHLLNQKHYKGAQEEFLSAYEHYRHKRYKESLNECLKTFESTMKSICDKHKWKYQPNATARSLIKVCFDNDLIPPFWDQQMTSLRSLLESSVPTGRNKLAGHGQGTEPTEIPEHLVAYMLHMTASTLVFLTTAEASL